MSCDLVHRFNETNKQSMNGGVFNGSYLPAFWARKCRCAECIMAKNTVEAKSLANSQNGYKNDAHKERNNGRDVYHHDSPAKKYLAADHGGPRNGNSVTLWNGKVEPERRPTSGQSETDLITSRLYQPKALTHDRYVTTPGGNKTNSFTQLPNAETIKEKKRAEKNYAHDLSWSGDELRYQSVKQTCPVKHFEDPRLKNHKKKDSIYHDQAYLVPTIQSGRVEGHLRPIEHKGTRGYREDTESKFNKNSSLAAWWSASSHRNHQSMPVNTKTCRTSTGEVNLPHFSQQPVLSNTDKRNLASHCTPDQVKNMDSKQNCESVGLRSYQKPNLPKSDQELLINQKEVKEFEDTKHSEICAREERIRNLKALLEKQERALKALRSQRKQFFTDDKCGSITCNKNHTKYSTVQGNKAILEECRPTDGAVISGDCLKRRWLRNWKEEDGIVSKFPKTEPREETHSHSTKFEEESQNLSNAEYTAVEGLVSLSKD